MSPQTPATLVVEGLDKVYGTGEQAVHAVREASFQVASGEFITIVGPSGSGKTTLLAMIGGLLTPTSGSIRLGDLDVTQLRGRGLAEYRRSSIGYVFQANNLMPFLTARENLMVMQAVAGSDRRAARERADRLLAELGIANRAKAVVTEMSGGERQRVAIGRALMNEPAVVLVDEPTANLDSERGRRVVTSLIEEVKGRDKVGIMVTHDIAMAELTDRILEMRDGVLQLRQASAPAATP
ncbi:MAG: ABC transporter ATP-binding protein [Dehalococcoidia bacterium]|nr:ABC transporter ATP-binding protein [Dehalococcoidia bacterium]